MPRRTAAERHPDPARRPAAGPAGTASTTELVDVLKAYYHPTRRWLTELLALDGPASVGRLAERTGLAVGSVSHHLKVLHRHGFIEPAPELARDTRESWWRSVSRPLSWSSDDVAPDTAGRRIAHAAEAENFRHQVRAVGHWLERAPLAGQEWRRAAGSADSLVEATAEELGDLAGRLAAEVAAWARECAASAGARPDAERRPVRVIIRSFPTEPVGP